MLISRGTCCSLLFATRECLKSCKILCQTFILYIWNEFSVSFWLCSATPCPQENLRLCLFKNH